MEEHPGELIRKFRPSVLYAVEDIEDYAPGGFHPVHLGDTFSNGRYRIVHKLGAGGYSTVWLARDEPNRRYVSVKILQAWASVDCSELRIQEHLKRSSVVFPGHEHIALLLDHFEICGPNGTHAALVYEVAGPSISSLYSRDGMVRGNFRLRGDLARCAALQTVKAVSFVHESDVVHGDLTTSNVLLKLAAIDSMSEADIYKRFGSPIKDDLFHLTELFDRNSAPEYIVESMDLGKLHPEMLTGDIVIIDFGLSFMANSPPADGIGTPSGYRAPELFFDGLPGKCSDIWALACTLFEIRSGSPLFAGYFGSADEALENIVKTLGKLPQPFHEKWQDEYEPDEDLLAGSSPLRSIIKGIGIDDGEIVGGPDERLTTDLFEKPRTTVSADEAALLQDLLEMLLKYKPDGRKSVDKTCEHPWFAFRR